MATLGPVKKKSTETPVSDFYDYIYRSMVERYDVSHGEVAKILRPYSDISERLIELANNNESIYDRDLVLRAKDIVKKAAKKTSLREVNDELDRRGYPNLVYRDRYEVFDLEKAGKSVPEIADHFIEKYSGRTREQLRSIVRQTIDYRSLKKNEANKQKLDALVEALVDKSFRKLDSYYASGSKCMHAVNWAVADTLYNLFPGTI